MSFCRWTMEIYWEDFLSAPRIDRKTWKWIETEGDRDLTGLGAMCPVPEWMICSHFWGSFSTFLSSIYRDWALFQLGSGGCWWAVGWGHLDLRVSLNFQWKRSNPSKVTWMASDQKSVCVHNMLIMEGASKCSRWYILSHCTQIAC